MSAQLPKPMHGNLIAHKTFRPQPANFSIDLGGGVAHAFCARAANSQIGIPDGVPGTLR